MKTTATISIFENAITLKEMIKRSKENSNKSLFTGIAENSCVSLFSGIAENSCVSLFSGIAENSCVSLFNIPSLNIA